VALRLARLRLAMDRHKTERDKPAGPPAFLKQLEQGLDKFKPEEQAQLLAAFGDAAIALQDVPTARAYWNRVAELRPRDLAVRTALFETSLQKKDKDGARQAVDSITKIEGPSRPLGLLLEAQLTIWEAEQLEPPDRGARLAEARALLDRVGTHGTNARSAALSRAR